MVHTIPVDRLQDNIFKKLSLRKANSNNLLRLLQEILNLIEAKKENVSYAMQHF